MRKLAKPNALNYNKMAKYVNRFHTFGFRITNRKRFNPNQKRSITMQYRELKLKQKVDKLSFKKAEKKQIQKARKAGKVVTNRGIFISVQKDAKGKKIPGSKVTIKKTGTIKIKNKQRIEFEFAFGKKLLNEFLSSQNETTTLNVLNALIKSDSEAWRLWKNRKNKRTLLFVFGRWPSAQPKTFNSPKAMADMVFEYISAMTENTKEKLTGIKIIFHIKPKGVKRGKKKKRSRKRRNN